MKEHTAAAQTEADRTIEDARRELEKVKETTKVTEEYALFDTNKVSLETAIGSIANLTDDINGPEVVKDAITQLKKDRGLTDEMLESIPLGNIVQLAVTGSLTHELFGDGKDVDKADMNEAITRVFDEWEKQSKNREILANAERKFIEKERAAKDMVTARAKASTDLFKLRNGESRVQKKVNLRDKLLGAQ